MTEMIDTVAMYFSFPFVQYAFLAGVAIALSSSMLGVTLVLKRFSYIGDGLSHVAFGAMSVSAACKIVFEELSASAGEGSFLSKLFENDIVLVLPITVIAAILILCARDSSKIKGDASVAMISVGSLALGYFVMNIFSPPSNLSGDVCSTLFGSTLILTLTKVDMVLSVVISLLVVCFFVFFFNRIFAITFDPDFAFACGTPTRLLNIVMASVIAVIIVLAMNLVGTLLISALIIFPPISAMMVSKSFKGVTALSCVVSVFGAAAGILVSIVAGTPVGSTIVIINIVCFVICKLISIFQK